MSSVGKLWSIDSLLLLFPEAFLLYLIVEQKSETSSKFVSRQGARTWPLVAAAASRGPLAGKQPAVAALGEQSADAAAIGETGSGGGGTGADPLQATGSAASF